MAVTLKQFLPDNANITSKPRLTLPGPGGSTMTDFAWTEVSTLAQVQEAMLNYGIVLMHLFPWDPTYFVINRILIKNNWAANISNMSERVKLLTTFFNATMRNNAIRATNRLAPLDYKETAEVFEGIFGSNLGSHSSLVNSDFTSFTGSFATSSGSAAANAGNSGIRANQQQARRGQGADQKQNPAKRAEYNGKGYCYGYNSTRGEKCRNSPTSSGCKNKSEQEFMHRCNVKNASGKICDGKHRRKDH